MLFAASIVGYLATRSANLIWRTPEMAELPKGLWLSTAVLLATSLALESARKALRHNRQQALLRRLWLSVACIAVFLLVQVQNWAVMHQGELAAPIRTLYPYTFYLLTGLHAAHVIGGLVPLGIVISRAKRHEYSSSRSEGLALCVLYWHYLGVIWLVLFSVLLIKT
jgi:cytochrome c oxidase subunit 3